MTLQYRFGFDVASALHFGKLPIYLSIIIAPIIGAAVDRFGHNLTFATIGSAFCLTANILLLFNPGCKQGEISPSEDCSNFS